MLAGHNLLFSTKIVIYYLLNLGLSELRIYLWLAGTVVDEDRISSVQRSGSTSIQELGLGRLIGESDVVSAFRSWPVHVVAISQWVMIISIFVTFSQRRSHDVSSHR